MCRSRPFAAAGLALLHGVPVGFHLSSALYDCISDGGFNLTLDDLREVDPQASNVPALCWCTLCAALHRACWRAAQTCMIACLQHCLHSPSMTRLVSPNQHAPYCPPSLPGPQLWQSYRAVLDAADVSSMGLTFTLTTAWLGHSEEVHLGGEAQPACLSQPGAELLACALHLPPGSSKQWYTLVECHVFIPPSSFQPSPTPPPLADDPDLPVCNANREEYVDAAVQHLLFTQVEEESTAFNRGLLDVLKVRQ